MSTSFLVMRAQRALEYCRWIEDGTPEMVEELAKCAHIAWAQNKGVEPNYDALPENVKEIDRAIVRSWLKLLMEKA